MFKEQIDSFIEESKEKIIDDISRLVNIKSINGHQKETQACLKHFLVHAEEMGFKTMHTSTWDVGIVEMGAGNETLGILVHLDVVEVGDRDKWTNDPFDCVERDGFLWGRGVVDDKGAAVMSLHAMLAVQRLGLPMQRKIWLIVGTSEESRWTDIENFKKEFPVPAFGFSPDGEFPIYNREKGFAEIILNFEQDSHRGIQKLRGGDSPNTIPSKAVIFLQNGQTLETQGVACHSSVPEEGENAILKLTKELEGENFDFVRFVNKYLQNDIHAKDLLLDDGIDTHQGEFIGLTTVAPTMLALEDDRVKLTINIRHKFGTTQNNILNAFERHAFEYGYKVTMSDYLDPMWVSKDLPFLHTMQEVCKEYGVEHGFRLAAGTSYAKSMRNFVLWGPVFEGDPMTAHMEDERLSVNTMMLAAKLYGRFISRMTLE